MIQLPIHSDQIIAASHDLTPNGGLVRDIPLFQGNLGWWNIIIWPDPLNSKKSPTGPTKRTPKPEYLIALQLTELGPLGFGPIQFLMDESISQLYFPKLGLQKKHFRWRSLFGDVKANHNCWAARCRGVHGKVETNSWNSCFFRGRTSCAWGVWFFLYCWGEDILGILRWYVMKCLSLAMKYLVFSLYKAWIFLVGIHIWICFCCPNPVSMTIGILVSFFVVSFRGA